MAGEALHKRMKNRDNPPQLSTQDIGSWEEVVCDLFVPLHCRNQGSGPFAASLSSFAAGDIALADLSVSAHKITRSAQEIRRSDAGFFLLSCQIEGVGGVVQMGRETVLGPGDCALYDTVQPYELVFPHAMRQRILRIPRDKLLSLVPDISDLTATRLTSSTPVGQLLATTISGYFDTIPHLPEVARDKIVNPLIELFAFAINHMKSDADAPLLVPRELLRGRVTVYIDENLASPNLSVQKIADAHRISTRYLHRLFTDTDETVSRYIWRRRLEKSAADLKDRSLAGRSITEISFNWGFNDAGHFSRQFRAHFGASPSDYRLLSMPA
jgi:AraC-like DNA-binding protein